MIIGVVTALTIPALNKNIQNREFEASFKKSYSVLNQLAERAQAEYGYTPRCYYYEKVPAHKCVQWDNKGFCTKYTMANGDPLISNVNGPTTDCTWLKNYMLSHLNIVKTCKNCLPDYKGNDTLFKEKNPSASEATVNKSAGCWYKKDNGSYDAYYLADGSILFRGMTLWGIDVNGFHGPNKWGYDVFSLSLVGNSDGLFQFSPTGKCSGITEPGGRRAVDILAGK